MSKPTSIVITLGVLFVAGSGIFFAAARAQQGSDHKVSCSLIRGSGNYQLLKQSRFAPGDPETVNGDFIQPGAFPTAEYCERCHQEAYHQWRQSLHANAFRTPFYLTSASILIRSKGIESSRYCDSCHNPIAVLSGALTQGSKVNRSFDADGVTCTVCHSIQTVQSAGGNGNYVMDIPAVMVDAKGNRIPGEVPYEEILKHPDRHSRAVMKDFYKTPEFCGACHKESVPTSLTGYRSIRSFDTYDEWQTSPFSRRNPLNFYPASTAICQDCHMPRVKGHLNDYGSKEGTFASHRWLAGNTAVPYFYKYDDQLEKTIGFLRSGRYLNVDIFGIKKAGSDQLIAPLGSTSFRLAQKDTVELFVVIQNHGIGHSLLPEIRDLYEAWVEFAVKDASGREIYHSGYLNPDGTLDQHAHRFENRPIDRDGKVVDNHEVWRILATGYDNTIQAGNSQLVRYQFQIPANVRGPLTVVAKVNYRHFRQSYLNTVLGKNHPSYPVVRLAEASRTLNIGENLPAPPDDSNNPGWMRWNNLGISYLGEYSGAGLAPSGAELYSGMIGAFQHALALKPNYADGYTNLALVNIEWKRFNSAKMEIRHALSLAPHNARALYYAALIDRQSGNSVQALADLESVVKQYPLSPDARRELGGLYLAEHNDKSAIEQFLALQQIDPENLAAHSNLSVLYDRNGMHKEAATERKLLADQESSSLDPGYSPGYLQSHPEMLTETVPGHIHTLSSRLGDRRDSRLR